MRQEIVDALCTRRLVPQNTSDFPIDPTLNIRSQRPRTSPQSDSDVQAGPLGRIVRGSRNTVKPKNSGQMKCEDPNREHQTDTGCAPAQQEVEADAQAGSDKSGAEECDPEHVPWNP